MTPEEAGVICRDSGFNWGRGSYWVAKAYRLIKCYEENFIYRNEVAYPYLLEASTRGVILEWAREVTGIHDLAIAPIYVPGEVVPWNGWDLLSASFGKSGRCGLDAKTEIECYAKLCQWVKENKK